MASGRLVVMSISKTVAAPSPSSFSTAMPARVRSSARRALSALISTKSRNHWGESFIAQCLCELLEESDITLEEHLNVVDAVVHHSQALAAHSKSETRNPGWVVAVIFDEAEDVGIDHAAAHEFDPAGLFTGAAAFAAADDAADGDVGAGLGKREERREETGLHAGAEQGFHGVVERAFEIAEGDVAIDGQAFDLVKDRGVAGVSGVAA